MEELSAEEMRAWAPRPEPGGRDAPRLPGYSGFRLVATGGEGEVYRARQDGLGRDVAIKVLQAADASTRARFQRELEITVRLGRQHPHVVTVLDTGVLPDGRPCIVMEYYDLGSLHDRLRARGPLPVAEVVAAGVAVADALAFAHAQGVLHRDVKPQNVLVLPTSYVLADFGIARGADAGHSTSLHMVSYRHAAPQMLDGAAPAAADDQWSLGSTLHTLLTGAPPFAGATPDEDTLLSYLDRVRASVPRPLTRPDVPPALRAVVERCLSKKREDRFPDTAALHDALSAVAADLRHWHPAAPPAAPAEPHHPQTGTAPGIAAHAPTDLHHPQPPAASGATAYAPNSSQHVADPGGTTHASTDLHRSQPAADPTARTPADQRHPQPPGAPSTAAHASTDLPAPAANPGASSDLHRPHPAVDPDATAHAAVLPPLSFPGTDFGPRPAEPPVAEPAPPAPAPAPAPPAEPRNTMTGRLADLTVRHPDPVPLDFGPGAAPASVPEGGNAAFAQRRGSATNAEPPTVPGLAPAAPLGFPVVQTPEWETPPQEPKKLGLAGFAIAGVLATAVGVGIGLLAPQDDEPAAAPTPTVATTTPSIPPGGNPAIAPVLTGVDDLGDAAALSWEDPTSGRAQFVVYDVSVGGDAPRPVVTVAAGQLGYTVTGLDPAAVRYCFQIVAIGLDDPATQRGASERVCVSR